MINIYKKVITNFYKMGMTCKCHRFGLSFTEPCTCNKNNINWNMIKLTEKLKYKLRYIYGCIK
jgi:hypothetical protein